MKTYKVVLKLCVAALIVTSAGCWTDAGDQPTPSRRRTSELCDYPQRFFKHWYKASELKVTALPGSDMSEPIGRAAGCSFENADATIAEGSPLIRTLGSVSLASDDGKNLLGSGDGPTGRKYYSHGVTVTEYMDRTSGRFRFLTLSAVLRGWRSEIELYVEDESAPLLPEAADLVVRIAEDLAGDN